MKRSLFTLLVGLGVRSCLRRTTASSTLATPMKLYITLFYTALLAACSPSQSTSTSTTAVPTTPPPPAFEGIGGSGSTGAGDSGDENDSEANSSSGDKVDAGVPAVTPLPAPQ